MDPPFVGAVKWFLPDIVEAINILPDDSLLDLKYLTDVLSDPGVPFLEGMAAFAFYTNRNWEYLAPARDLALSLVELGPLTRYVVALEDPSGRGLTSEELDRIGALREELRSLGRGAEPIFDAALILSPDQELQKIPLYIPASFRERN